MPTTTAEFDTTPLHAWLIDRGLAGVPVPALLEGFCERAVDAGLPLARGYLSAATLHPLIWASGFRWKRHGPIEAVDIAYGFENQSEWVSSPFRHMIEAGEGRLRCRLCDGNAPIDFPVLGELRDAGFTDWIARFFSYGWPLKHGLVGELGVILSWATDHAGGWDDAELRALEELSGTLALAARSSGAHEATQELLATYVGRDAADRIVVGQVQRGSVEKRTAIILNADLRGFTDFAESVPAEEVTRRLNGFFDCIAEPVKTAGGEILKFLGDGFLALFLAGDGRETHAVAAEVFDAARRILNNIARLNEVERRAGHPPFVVDIALHRGDVTYGNVGTVDRLDFTVIGPTVNEVSRLEGLCKELDRQLLVSESFARSAPGLLPRLRSRGSQSQRGGSGRHVVYNTDETVGADQL
jgi:adenylate cyclase